MTETPTDPAPQAQADAPAPAQRPTPQVLERLFELHPKLFGARFLPLKLGVFQDIVARHPGEFGKDELKAALGLHTRSTRYLESVAAGHARHDLDAQAVEPVAPEHVHHAIMEIARRRRVRGKDPAAWVRERLVAAIESCGLDRAEFEARVNAKDDAALAVLDDAFGALREKQARREALQRAFAASGKPVAEFAAMYGLDAREAQRLLGPKPA